MHTILLIEDDAALGAQVVKLLQEADCAVVWRKEGRYVSADDLTVVDLIILDLMLPGTPGLDVLKQVREISEVPVLVLSARQDSGDKVRALQLGADDYVTKPFWPEELVERIRARLRRPVLQRSATIEAGPLALDLDKREARCDGEMLELTRAEFDVLVALAKRAGRPVSRQWLLTNALDPEREATERTLDVHISRLRKKVGDASIIETVWGIGYRLRAKADA